MDRATWFGPLLAALFSAGLLAPFSILHADQRPRSDEGGKFVIYQLLPRLFGNKITTNKPWGRIEDNGVGKFADINEAALTGLRELGVSHVWYTGVPHHAVIRDYSAFGIASDDPDVVKGRAGSPYAVRDYYNVNPDLAEDPAKRLDEFHALLERTHSAGMKVIIDIVPNHVARRYQSLSAPDGVRDFGVDDDTSVAYKRDNNFYYVPGTSFQVPKMPANSQPLGGEAHPLADGKFTETPAKWTGNGSRAAQPSFDDWYETVKINYGVRPDGSYDFPTLPASYAQKGVSEHLAFWAVQQVPNSWRKFRDITAYWLAFGVDGFRYDMAEMIPVEFWSYLNSHIKSQRPDALLLAEVYQPDLYRDYIRRGKMDYLYDKVDLYDGLKAIVQSRSGTGLIAPALAAVADIEHHMLHFLENHDEQRIASPGFAGDPERAKPAMVLSATISSSPTMLYFGQEVGEAGTGDAGFGRTTRTTIFDYWGVPAHQRWMNAGAFDGGQLSQSERELRDFHARLLGYTARAPVLMGAYAELHNANRSRDSGYGDRHFAFLRWTEQQQIFVVCNFDWDRPARFNLHVPATLISKLGLADGDFPLNDVLSNRADARLVVVDGEGSIAIDLAPLASSLLARQHD